MNKDTVRQLLVIIATLATLVVNGLSEALPLNGLTSAEIANRYPIYFLPANYVFSIWGVIYLGMIAFTIYQALPAQRENPLLRKIGYLYVVTAICNCTWLFLFHYELFAVSTIAMVILLGALIAMYLRIQAERAHLSTAATWTIRIPISIYFGWITVATVANFTYVLYYAHWDGFGLSDMTWGAIMLVVAALIAGYVAYSRRDIAYAAVIVWAFVGIIVRFTDVMAIALTAGLMAAVVAAAALISTFLSHRGNGLNTRPV